MKLKLIALAAMLAASGVAQAKIANSNDNGNLSSGDMFASLVSVSNTASFTVDLGLRLDQFAAASVNADGVKLVWDMANSSFSDLSTVSTGLAGQLQTLNYGSVYSTFATPGVISASDLKFDIKAMDGLPTNFASAGQNRYLSTSAASSITATNGQVFGMDAVDTYIDAVNGDATNSTHGTAFNTAGANKFDSGDGVNVDFAAGGDQWNGKTSFSSTGAVSPTGINGGDLNFYFLTNTSGVAASQASVTKYAGVWSFDTATAQLSYATAAPVPEAETYAMMLAGLGLVGFMVSRRRKLA
ncbi:PEP-CTERM sorting domain-containing protein [Thiobacillus denitrificans]|uniref:Ice-binding protein C-terminal domain-containing protein n=1 Tax=Thiobacillus denitrificans TaxID=36861 RepID=A0A106BMD2_THIDE|nr:PEP-CTERM sorting domain-containing protein [Thiobacillus denitrificans]KVW95126.1 hypothetical protein ABW22_10800 [Thiobacillus denitrificans]